ncbi:uncharacterized protein PFL1_02641 [Pseudozyma flocculosa PF-1]|uniref:Related to Calcium-transporting ATPase 3 n=2 Tax=Pseudozyma flocculosa TaxID=84751 RepID=A0A5C3EYF6_9BASI|nr:uncharacterized protein PFL1_02641 [Pseudozyma flocculosa PF-1]EPQ29969.1 hypothetical protein PFL1_02641 [Pseudozyma flocculosa PF-1]SPO37284.1 related to Calcium-transporting ATPase 3 [Pseudozyma flocculosa]
MTAATAAAADAAATARAAQDGPLPAPAHTLDAQRIVEAFETDIDGGLTHDQVRANLERYGPNRLKEVPPPSFLAILVRNTLNAMTIVLIAAMAVSFGTQDFISGGVIAALVVINVAVGTVNEYLAERTVAALEAIGSPSANVVRRASPGSAPEIATIKTEDVVPGDVLIVKIGDIVPADCRILGGGHLAGLECDEALLTGESLPSVKTEEPIPDPVCPVGDRTCLIYSGSQAVKGRARVVCVATGMQTELGKISEAMNRKENLNKSGWAARRHRINAFLGLADTTPLQIKLNKLAYVILGLACVVAVIVVASTGFRDVPLTIATYAVAAAVSLLPASLPAVIALSLATASRKLAESNALVRRMDAIETLAAVTDVCSDKTGTITLGKMVTRRIWVPARLGGAHGGAEDEAQEKAAPEQPDADVDVDVHEGQYYTVETGSDPFQPRGEVRAGGAPKGDVLANARGQDETAVPTPDGELCDPDHLALPLHQLTLCAALCSSASIQRVRADGDGDGEQEGQKAGDNEEKGDARAWEGHGDATEVALQVYAHKLGYGKPHLTSSSAAGAATDNDDDDDDIIASARPGQYELLVEHAFDSSIKRMSMAYVCRPRASSSDEEHVLVVMKGAFERVFDRCTDILLDDGAAAAGQSTTRPITADDAAEIQAHYDRLASDGLRVLTLCAKRLPVGEAERVRELPRDELETGMAFLGLAGIYDPPRTESALAVEDCHRASIIPRMLTGDHVGTAIAIALQVGILRPNYAKTAVMTGPQFDALSDDDIDRLDALPNVVARCAPETKVRMVEALHRRCRLCVMTGDGVNDAPSLKRADVGVAMGKNGSDVAKQSAEIVLSDDNFATIVTAVRKGRGIFTNLAAFMLYLQSANIGQVALMLLGLAFKDESGESTFPISSVAILWINTLCAGPPALALGLEPTPSDAMEKRPSEYASIFTFWWIVDLFAYGIVMAAIALLNFVAVMWGYFDGYLGLDCNSGVDSSACNHTGRARGAVFATFLIVLMVHGFVCKHPTQSIFAMDLLENRVLLWSVVLISLSVFPVIYIPVINDKVFLLLPIKWEWGMVAASTLVFLVVTELYKLARRMWCGGDDARAKVRREGLPLDGDGDEALTEEKRREVREKANVGGASPA